MLYAGVVMYGKTKLESKNPKVDKQVLNLDYINDIAIPKLNNNQIPIVIVQ